MTAPGGEQAGRVRFANPVLPGDFSDPDVLRDGDDYWMISSTFEYSPGMVVLHSRDLVTWSFAGHCVEDLTELGPAYASDLMQRDGRGIFAGSLRKHDGIFYVYFTTLDEGMFVTTADHPTGPWSPPHRVWDERFWDDPCPLWDEDGAAWIVASRPGEPVDDGWMTYILPMSADGMSVDPAGIRILDPTWSSEGNKIYRIDGQYIVLHNESRSAGNRVAVVMRAASLDGPWEKRDLILGGGADRDREPCQGALVDTVDGRWFFVTHHGRLGYADGRPVSVVPVQWIDGWPIAGEPGSRSLGDMVWEAALPLPDAERGELSLSDDFTGERLGLQWEWRYQPAPGSWQLDPAGGLRLRADPLLREGDPRSSRCTLTQRQIGVRGVITAEFDVSGLTDGARLGLGHLGGQFSAIQIAQDDGERVLRIVVGEGDGRARVEHSLSIGFTPRVVLQTAIDDLGYASFQFALDERRFEPFGDVYRPSYRDYRGNRLAIQFYNERERTGTAVVRRFDYDREPRGDASTQTSGSDREPRA